MTTRPPATHGGRARRLICAECPWTSDDPFPHPVGDDATDLPARTLDRPAQETS